MTEASKARKRYPMRIIHGAQTDPENRAAVMRALSMLRSTIVLPPAMTYEFVYPKSRRPVSVLLSGVSVRAGVGGRRGERRRRAMERVPPWKRTHPPGCMHMWGPTGKPPGEWVLFAPGSQANRETADLIRWANRETMQILVW